jgi:hypothetical protein
MLSVVYIFALSILIIIFSGAVRVIPDNLKERFIGTAIRAEEINRERRTLELNSDEDTENTNLVAPISKTEKNYRITIMALLASQLLSALMGVFSTCMVSKEKPVESERDFESNKESKGDRSVRKRRNEPPSVIERGNSDFLDSELSPYNTYKNHNNSDSFSSIDINGKPDRPYSSDDELR